MSRVTLVRYAAKPDRAAENEALSRAVFTELHALQPQNVAYGLFRDGDNFVHVLVNLRGDDSGVVTDLPTFRAFTEGGPDRQVAPPEVLRLDLKLVDSYGFATEMTPA